MMFFIMVDRVLPYRLKTAIIKYFVENFVEILSPIMDIHLQYIVSNHCC